MAEIQVRRVWPVARTLVRMCSKPFTRTAHLLDEVSSKR